MIDMGEYLKGSAGSDRGCWKANQGYSNCHPLGALKDEGIMPEVPYDPGKNAYTDCSHGCGGAQFYSYWSDGQYYRLACVLEEKGCSDCKNECGSWWGGNKYHFCINQGI